MLGLEGWPCGDSQASRKSQTGTRDGANLPRLTPTPSGYSLDLFHFFLGRTLLFLSLSHYWIYPRALVWANAVCTEEHELLVGSWQTPNMNHYVFSLLAEGTSDSSVWKGRNHLSTNKTKPPGSSLSIFFLFGWVVFLFLFFIFWTGYLSQKQKWMEMKHIHVYPYQHAQTYVHLYTNVNSMLIYVLCIQLW